MTKDCIENFNTNFFKVGKFEIFAGGMGYDENNPITETEENIVNRASEIDYMLGQLKWQCQRMVWLHMILKTLLGGQNDSKENKRCTIVNFYYCSCIHCESDSLFS